MGSISAGKSSILNKLLNKELEFGVGETTLSVDKIYSNNKVEVSDSPGINKDYDIFDVEVLKELLEMDIFIVCFQNCLS
jgi:ribosome biogenesis GTPase A